MTAKECCDILMKAGVRATSIRILVYKALTELTDTFSLTDLEGVLYTVDKSSIFRTLTLFHDHHLIHSVDDGSGFLKYCLCHNFGACSDDDTHCHFYCRVCGKTYCLDHDSVPEVLLPEGFVAQRVNYVVKGVCAGCVDKGY